MTTDPQHPGGRPPAPRPAALAAAAQSALLGASFALVLSFGLFMLMGFGIDATLVWMLALGLLAFGATFAPTLLIACSRERRAPGA